MLGAQAAREQERREARTGTVSGGIRPVDEAQQQYEALYRSAVSSIDVRLGVLRLAQDAPGADTVAPEDVVKRATVYLTFIKGEAHG